MYEYIRQISRKNSKKCKKSTFTFADIADNLKIENYILCMYSRADIKKHKVLKYILCMYTVGLISRSKKF